MTHCEDALEKSDEMKIDRRLQRRRDWVQPADHQKTLDRLPDSADKAEWLDAPGAPKSEPHEGGQP